jgi:hypothetical protein
LFFKSDAKVRLFSEYAIATVYFLH